MLNFIILLLRDTQNVDREAGPVQTRSSDSKTKQGHSQCYSICQGGKGLLIYFVKLVKLCSESEIIQVILYNKV